MEHTKRIYNFLHLYNFHCPENSKLCSHILNTIYIPTQENNEAMKELHYAEIFKSRKQFSIQDKDAIDLVFLRFKHKVEQMLRN